MAKLGLERWIGRCASLVVVALVLAVGQAAVQPPRRSTPASPPPPAPASINAAAAQAGATDTVAGESGAQPAAAPGQMQASETRGQEAPPTGAPMPGADTSDTAWVREQFDSGAAFLIDARPLSSFEQSHIAGAFHLEFGMFSTGPPDLLPMIHGMPLIIYCTGGDCDASHKVKQMLEHYGFDSSLIYVYVPGFPGLEEAGFPLESGPPEF